MSEKKPNVADNELNKMKGQLDAYEDNVKSLTVDRMNQALRWK
jgi:hypothetical protein